MIPYRRKHGMRAVQQGHFPFMIRGLARHEKDIQPGLVGRELFCHGFRGLDHPEVENFSLDYQMVVIPYSLMYLIYGIFRVSRNYSVHQRAIYSAGRLEPVPEAFFQSPELDILPYALLQFLSVQENKFAREYDQAFRLVSAEMPVSPVKQLRKLSRI